MNQVWLEKKELRQSEWFFYSFSVEGVEGPFLFPILAYKYRGEFLILDGNKRFSIHMEKYPVLYWDEEELTPFDALMLSIRANDIFRELNFIEKSNILKIVKDYFPDKTEEIRKYFHLSRKDSRLLQSLTILHEELKKQLIKWKIPLKYLAMIGEDPDDWNNIWDKLRSYKLTSARFSWIVESVFEISRREGVTPSSIFSTLSLEHEDLEALLKEIKKRRYPVMSTLWHKKEKLENVLPSGFGVDIPENFEGDSVIIKVRVRKNSSTDQIMKKLAGLIESGELKSLLSEL